MKDNIMDDLRKQFAGKKVLVVGLGVLGGGLGLAKFFHELDAKVKITDLRNEEILKSSSDEIRNLNLEMTLGKHDLKDFLETDYIFKGPSVPWALPHLVEAQKRGVKIDMEVSFFATHCPAKIIGITGTRGKSTTASLIFDLLQKNNFPSYLGGSLPQVSTINLLKKLKKGDWVVLELPSWPLSGFHRAKVSPHIAVFTNFYPDHLNYYPSLSDYLYDKKAIYLYQKETDFLVANITLKDIIKKDKPKSNTVYYSASDFLRKLNYLKGEHNLENAAAAFKVAQILKIPQDKALNAIVNFKGLPFRLEVVGKKDQVVFINDTTSTMPVATIKAIETFSSKPVVLILGGNSKGLPYGELVSHLTNVTKIILLKGSYTDQLLPLLKTKYRHKISGPFDDLKTAVETAFFQAKQIAADQRKQVILLFSPGATSFAMFKNEFHRGEEYNKIVRQIL